MLALAVLLSVTLTSSALFLACASFARDFRDGQTMLTPVYMAVALPGGGGGLPTIELNAWTAFVPTVNVTLLVKALVLREASAELAFLALLSACTYATVAIAGAVHVFHRESVPVGEKTSIRTILGVRLGVLRWRSGSVVPGMVRHAINNGLIGTLAQRPELAAWFGMHGSGGAMSWGPVLTGTVVMGAALGVSKIAAPATSLGEPRV